jgi:hypothetical protein
MSTPPTIIGPVLPAMAQGVGTVNDQYRNPQFTEYLPKWEKMRHCYAGQDTVKSQGERYLPPTAGMVLDGMGPNDVGRKAYTAYIMRAKFHGFVEQGVSTNVGLLEQKPSTFQLTPKLQSLLEKATKDGETLDALFRRIKMTQLLTGRIGLLFDIDTTDPANVFPFIATYEAEAIPNWEETNAIKGVNQLSMVLLDESSVMRTKGFNWQLKYRYRCLSLGSVDSDAPVDNADTFDYTVQVYEDQAVPTKWSSQVVPNISGRNLNKIPFVIINTTHTLSDVEKPPLEDLADISLTLYRTEADYRQNLYMQGQDTVVVVGGEFNEDKPLRTGSGAAIYVPIGGDAKFIGVNSQGLSELRQAVQNDEKAANAKSGQIISQMKSNAESGQALGTRLAAQTATLNTIALSAAAGLQKLLRIGAEWFGENPEDVKVSPNLEFTDFSIPGQEIQAIVVSKDAGLPISYESIHGMLVDKGLTKKSWDEEQAALKGDPKLRDAWGLPPIEAPKPAATQTGTMPKPGGTPPANDPAAKPGVGS